MKKVIGLSLCIVCVLTLSAFDWGRKSQPKTDPQSTQNTDAIQPVSAPVTPSFSDKNVSGDSTYSAMQPTVPPATASSKGQKKSKKTSKSSQQKVTPPANVEAVPAAAPASDKAIAIVTLAKIVGSGTPEERKARIESLKRLSQALAKSQGLQT